MARLQILELPTEHHGDDMVTPWILVIDQASEDVAKTLEGHSEVDSLHDAAIQKLTGASLAERIGARAVLVFEETIDIPANEVTIDDGQTVRLKIEGDFTAFREQAMREIAQAQADLRAGLR
ncbi:hypothetical protein [Streptomyces antimycoticus]|uniref:hypothetical protein n=1 Tax=Streptomyces antimycoticus TaxID=68175 RepID=UPI003865BFE1|nr:hypothetical protein OG751_03995 [Streptomyces antimycoticus]